MIVLKIVMFEKLFFVFFHGQYMIWTGLIMMEQREQCLRQNRCLLSKQMILVLDFDQRSSSRCLETESRLQGQKRIKYNTMKPEFDKKKYKHFIFAFCALHRF